MASSAAGRLASDSAARAPRGRPPRRCTGRWGRGGWLASATCAAVVALLVFNVTEFLNPDWFGYQLLFEQEGGWLADQGRDPLFLWLVSLAATSLGPDGYYNFRLAVAIYFVSFAGLLGRGRLLPFVEGAPPLAALLLALLLFCATRFTIQIREGIAMSLVLLALRPIWGVRGESTRFGRAWLLLLAASLFHGGVAILPLAFAFACLNSRGRQPPRTIVSGAPWPGVLLAAAFGSALSLMVLMSSQTAEVIETLAPGREVADGASLVKFMFWAAIGLCVAVLAADSVRGIAKPDAPPVLQRFIRTLALLALPAIFAALLTLLAGDAPAVLISATARYLHVITGLLVLLMTLRRAMTARMALASALLLADQVRVGVDALIGTFAAVPT